MGHRLSTPGSALNHFLLSRNIKKKNVWTMKAFDVSGNYVFDMSPVKFKNV